MLEFGSYIGFLFRCYSDPMMQNKFICKSANIEELDPDFADMPMLRKRRDNVNTPARFCPNPSEASPAPNATLVFKHPDA